MQKINDSSIWYEKYKPSTVEDIVLPEEVKSRLLGFIEKKDIPNLGLFSSEPGTGKSSTANAILKDLDGEALWINASMMNGIDVLRGQISKFASQVSFDGEIKVVVLDEADHISRDAQAAFRGFIDEFSENCKFIFTGNYKERLIEPLLDRIEVYDFNDFNKRDMLKPIFGRLEFILKNENIEYDQKVLVSVLNTYYPSIRSMIGALQRFSKDGNFTASESDLQNVSTFDSIINLLDQKTYTALIQAVNDLNSPGSMYKFLYDNAPRYFKEEKYPNVVITVAKYQHMHDSVRDKSLNLAACLTELLKFK